MLFSLLNILVVVDATDASVKNDKQGFLAHVDMDAVILETIGREEDLDVKKVIRLKVAPIEKSLNATYISLAKNLYKKLDYGSSRYILYRYFVDRHGWSIHGLENVGAEYWSDQPPSMVLKGSNVESMMDLFDYKYMRAGGYDLRDIAMLAASVETIERRGARSRMEAAFEEISKPLNAHLNVEEVERAIQHATVIFYEPNATRVSDDSILLDGRTTAITDIIGNWQEHIDLIKSTRNHVFDGINKMSYSFYDALAIIEKMADGFGEWQDKECRMLKKELVNLEEPGTGRVKITSFYNRMREGVWQFSESIEMLRHLDVLDEFGSEPRVIIPNWLVSAPQCLKTASEHFSLCCLDECEQLLRKFEVEIGGPNGTPEQIATITSELGSSTVEAPRVLPQSLRMRIDEIAAKNGGGVPLHGRLFSQFMHHAYPRECKFPHKTGRASVLTIRDFLILDEASTVGQSQEVFEKDLKDSLEDLLKNHRPAENHVEGNLPWHEDEVLLNPNVPVDRKKWVRLTFFGFALFAMGTIFKTKMNFAIQPSCSDSDKKVFKAYQKGYNAGHLHII